MPLAYWNFLHLFTIPGNIHLNKFKLYVVFDLIWQGYDYGLDIKLYMFISLFFFTSCCILLISQCYVFATPDLTLLELFCSSKSSKPLPCLQAALYEEPAVYQIKTCMEGLVWLRENIWMLKKGKFISHSCGISKKMNLECQSSHGYSDPISVDNGNWYQDHYQPSAPLLECKCLSDIGTSSLEQDFLLSMSSFRWASLGLPVLVIVLDSDSPLELRRLLLWPWEILLTIQSLLKEDETLVT